MPGGLGQGFLMMDASPGCPMRPASLIEVGGILYDSTMPGAGALRHGQCTTKGRIETKLPQLNDTMDGRDYDSVNNLHGEVEERGYVEAAMKNQEQFMRSILGGLS